MKSSFKHDFLKVANHMMLTRYQKDIIHTRYLGIVTSAESAYRVTTFSYFLFTNLITVCGILVTAFVSFDRLGAFPTNSTSGCNAGAGDILVSVVFLWVVWGLGIILSISSAMLQTFNIPKKYVLNIVVLEKLYSEGWSFASNIGKYKAVQDMDGKFTLFCERIERIKLKSVETMRDDSARDDVTDILSAGFDDRDGSDGKKAQTTSRRARPRGEDSTINPYATVNQSANHTQLFVSSHPIDPQMPTGVVDVIGDVVDACIDVKVDI